MADRGSKIDLLLKDSLQAVQDYQTLINAHEADAKQAGRGGHRRAFWRIC